jgi:CBS domain-containing protein
VKTPLLRDIMTRDVLTVESDWSLDALRSFLVEHSITGAPVVDRFGKLLGVVSSTDLLQADERETTNPRPAYFCTTLERSLAESELRTMHVEGGSSQRVSDVMTPVVFAVDENTSVLEVADMMALGRIHRVVVKSGDRLSGIVTTLDLVGVLRSTLRSSAI